MIFKCKNYENFENLFNNTSLKYKPSRYMEKFSLYNTLIFQTFLMKVEKEN